MARQQKFPNFSLKKINLELSNINLCMYQPLGFDLELYNLERNILFLKHLNSNKY